MNSVEFEFLAREIGFPAAYGQATGRESWGDRMEEMLPGHMVPGFCRWILFGEYSGDFLNAFVRGNLFGAMAKADQHNIDNMHRTCMFFWNYAPSGCFGDEARAERWNAQGGMLGKDTA